MRYLPLGRSIAVSSYAGSLAPPQRVRDRYFHGRIAYEADLHEAVPRSLFFYGYYERIVTAVFLGLLAPGRVVYDVGANFGYYTLLAAQHVGPDGRVFSFEPDEDLTHWLRRNLELNKSENVVVEPTAVSNGKGSIPFKATSRQNWSRAVGTTVVRASDQAVDLVRVPAISLDEHLAERGMEHVDLVKMDIEGVEVAAVQGMQRGHARSGIAAPWRSSIPRCFQNQTARFVCVSLHKVGITQLSPYS